MQGVLEKKLIQTTSCHFLAVLNHPEAGVSTNVFLRILHNRALDLGWIVQPVIAKKGWPKIRYGHRRGITREEHETHSGGHQATGLPATSLSCFGKPAVLRRILRVSRLTILIGQIDGCTTNGRSSNRVVRAGLVWPSVAVSKAF